MTINHEKKVFKKEQIQQVDHVLNFHVMLACNPSIAGESAQVWKVRGHVEPHLSEWGKKCQMWIEKVLMFSPPGLRAPQPEVQIPGQADLRKKSPSISIWSAPFLCKNKFKGLKIDMYKYMIHSFRRTVVFSVWLSTRTNGEDLKPFHKNDEFETKHT